MDLAGSDAAGANRANDPVSLSQITTKNNRVVSAFVHSKNVDIVS